MSKTHADFAEKFQDADIVVFWGSQSGTAERLAARLCKEIRQRFGKKALAADASDYETASVGKLSSSRLAIYIVSTFGEGDPSDNMIETCGWLEAAKGTPFSQLQFVTLGLGNSNYRYFSSVADLVAERLMSLGATSLLPVAKADDAQGQTEEHYLEWKQSVFELLKTKMGFEERDPVYEPSLKVVEDASIEDIILHTGEPKLSTQDKKISKTMSPVHHLPVKATRELFTDTNGRNCIHMEIDLGEQPGMKYKTGDHLGVWASNPQSEVDTLLRCLGLQTSRSTPISMKSLDPEVKLKAPTPTTWEALFGNYLEICAAVSRESIASLIQFAPSPSAKETLVRLSSDKSAYDQISESAYFNLGRLLQYVAPGEGSWKDLPPSLVIEILPAMQPRYYSISSSAVVHARKVAITAVVSDKKLSGEGQIPGLCTNYLLNVHRSLEQNPSTRLHAHIRKSTFKLPALPSQPIIMVAAGTGIAPFRAFMQERTRLLSMGKPIGRTILFFGCRNAHQDFLYADELREWENTPGLNFSLVTAFSRPDADSGEKKVYVQDRVQEHAEEVCDLVTEKGAYIYFCGSAAMARDVSKVVGGELQTRRNWDEEMLREWMEKQKRTRRWQQDVWG